MEAIWGQEIRVLDELQEDNEDEEALSLSDLPLIPKNEKDEEDEDGSNSKLPSKAQISKIQEEFDFCSFSKQSEMCTADEVFFHGQILPLRHSVSSEKGLLLHSPTRPVSRSESMDHLYSGGSIISSRSSSISSSGGSSVSNPVPKFRPRYANRNHFHSHPSPSPRIRFPKPGPTAHRNSFNKKSSIWNIFRLGLVSPPPEIAFQDLKSRCPGSKTFGSRNSTSSHGSSSTITSSKRKARTLLVAGGCRSCTSDAVAAVPSKIVTIKRSASEGEQAEPQRIAGKEKKAAAAAAAKKQLSHNRTFEWIKQLSLEGAPDEA